MSSGSATVPEVTSFIPRRSTRAENWSGPRAAAASNHGQFMTRPDGFTIAARRCSGAMYRPPELASLRAELRAAGLFEHREVRSWLKLGVLLSGLAASFVMIA